MQLYRLAKHQETRCTGPPAVHVNPDEESKDVISQGHENQLHDLPSVQLEDSQSNNEDASADSRVQTAPLQELNAQDVQTAFIEKLKAQGEQQMNQQERDILATSRIINRAIIAKGDKLVQQLVKGSKEVAGALSTAMNTAVQPFMDIIEPPIENEVDPPGLVLDGLVEHRKKLRDIKLEKKLEQKHYGDEDDFDIQLTRIQ